MTISQLCLVSLGITANALTFVLGILVGISLSRKESKNDNCNEGTSQVSNWHYPIDRNAEGRPGCGKGRCAHSQPEAGAAERAAAQRRHHGE